MNFWKVAYEHGWVTIAQLKTVVAKGKITADEFKEITGEDYTA